MQLGADGRFDLADVGDHEAGRRSCASREDGEGDQRRDKDRRAFHGGSSIWSVTR
jgi:hypothetical protein